MSYAKAGKQAECHAKGTMVTDTTVMNVVRKLNPERYENIPKGNKKRICSTLYIEADEDHVADQQRGSKRNNKFEQKLVYVHEGRKRISKDRNELRNAHYFTFLSGTDTSKIWETIWRYIHNTYEIESIEKIYVVGDGAPWIKAGADYLPNAKFVLDRFHLQEATLKIAGQDKERLKQLNKSIWTNKRSEAIKLFQELYIFLRFDKDMTRIPMGTVYLSLSYSCLTLSYQGEILVLRYFLW